MANWWDKNLTDKQKFRLQEPKDPSLLDVVSTVPNPVGDVASGLLAAQDFSKGNYGTAALNSLGLLPFVPSMGGVVKNVGKSAKTEFELANDLAQQRAALPISEGGLGLPVTNTAMDRANALGFDTNVYRGISPLTQELNQKDYALWAASNPTVASTYAGAEGGYVMPLKIKNNDLANIDFRGKEWDVVPYPAIVSYKNNDFIVPKENKKSLVSDSIGRFSKNLGSQGLQMENIVDFGLQKEGVNLDKLNDIEYGGVPVDSYVMFNPSNVRSRFAAFDPFRRNEADILAGVAPLAVGSLLGLNTYNNMQEKPKKETKKTK